MDGRKSAADDDPGAEAEYVGSFVGGTDDPLELVWGRGGGGGGRGLQSYPAILERGLPPSEDVMAAWLYPIVSGEDCTVDDRLEAPTANEPAMAMGTMRRTDSGKGKLPATDVMFGATKVLCRDPNSSEKKKASEGTNSRKAVSSATHNMTEKRRRRKIAERFRTLQQLVPGCDHKSNQSLRLDRTIHYMRSLQQQVQLMSSRWQAPPTSATAVAYPVVPPAATVAMPMPPAATFRLGVVPMTDLFGAMLPYPHYHAPRMHVATSASLLYPPVQAVASAAATDATGDLVLCSVSMEQQQH